MWESREHSAFDGREQASESLYDVNFDLAIDVAIERLVRRMAGSP